MNHSNRTRPFRHIAHLLAIGLMLNSWSAQATAPRVAPKMFGEAQQIDIVGYSSNQISAASEIEGKLTGDLLEAAFKAGGMQPNIDVLPSKQLAKYEFVVNQVPALIVAADGLSAKEKKRYRTVTYFLSDVVHAKSPVLLAFDLNNPRGAKLYKAFDQGLQKIVGSGQYLELMHKHLGQKALHADYLNQLKSLNPGWK
ncbi:MAG: hypothetical protein IPM27_00705 [Nitrosomonadales bacterium]|nr:hypothetical protein [Nitrosomonadales bacterium]